MRFSWLVSALALSVLIAALQHYAVSNFLYWHYPWFDVPMHLLGGAVVATLLVALIRRFRPILFASVIAAVFVGWEVFEYAFGIPREANYAFDTALDLLDGAIGAILVYGIARTSVWR